MLCDRGSIYASAVLNGAAPHIFKTTEDRQILEMTLSFEAELTQMEKKRKEKKLFNNP